MKTSKPERKNLKKTILATALTVGVGTAGFIGLTHVTAGTQLNKTENVPTKYTQIYTETRENILPDGYQKANYTVSTIDLEYYKKQSPTSKDMAMEDAAEIGAQALWSVFGVSLEDGQVIEMGYNEANESLPRSLWLGIVEINDHLSYSFNVDSVTGELFSIGKSRTLKEDVSVAFDMSLEKNPEEFTDLAKETAEKLNVVHGSVASVEYQGQGYSNNDPDIMIEVQGANGEIAQLVFSRYDRSLVSIAYPASYQYTLEEIERIEQELERLNSMHLGDEDAEGKEPALIVIPENEKNN